MYGATHEYTANKGSTYADTHEYTANKGSTYAEVLRTNIQGNSSRGQARDGADYRNHTTPKIATLFLFNLPPQARAREVWDFFRGYNIHDIILLKRRYVRDNRYGFIQMKDKVEAGDLVKNLNGNEFLGKRLLIRLNLSVRENRHYSNNSRNDPQRQGSTYQKNGEDHIETQPAFRTINLEVDDKIAQELQRSVIGKTHENEWADILQEKIWLQGLTHIQVKGISHRKFLITFSSKEDMDEQLIHLLKKWFWQISEVTHLDLVPPE